MTVLQEFVAALSSGRIQVVDLTAPLSDQTPILGLPEQFGQTWPFQLSEISRYDDRGPAWYWNTSPPVSTPAPTSTPRCTGSPVSRARTCRRSR
ncbi:hypothetical protein [Micromonospora sp. WMMD964]|uniref:hypothetical protein n=1 Tax=Micromonospora sp. WMMD964 TaxID=3016091 RepID=UPI00249C0561|nr:hypothetical protein [Micromonospora sp. WMMD964]WFF04483.1 hypothetical protein O7616_24520 [Micromonospora sp. WMMD964]